jgi:hypothetical protein
MSWGHFEGELDIRLVVDTSSEDRLALTLAPFVFVRATGERVEVPAGFVFDGASVPRLLWRVIGSPFTGDYRRAACVHDYLCGRWGASGHTAPEAHRIFYEAMRADGCGWIRAGMMWAAVRAFGPRW